MNPKIKEFWEKSGTVWEQTTPDAVIGVTNVPCYWFDEDNSSRRIIIACPIDSVTHELVYFAPPHSWVSEAEMLRIVELKAFL